MSISLELGSGGLCSTCNNGPTCTYRSRRGFDALFCEMFDDYVPQGNCAHPTAYFDVTSRNSAKTPKAASPALARGLCANCESHESCMLPKPEAGVWHCEEYR